MILNELFGNPKKISTSDVISRLRELKREFPLAAERNRAEVDKKDLTLSEYRQKFKFKSKQAERNFIAEMNGVVSLDTWCQLMFTHHSSNRMLSETINETTINDINLLRSFSVDNVEVGQSYIPIPFMVIGSEIQLMDIAGNYPAKVPASMCELVSVNENEYKFRVGDRVISYPDEKINGKLLMSIVICGSEEVYDQLRMTGILKDWDHLPKFNDVNEEYTDASATTPDTDTMANNMNQAGANYAVHAQMDQDVQNRYAAQKPIGTVKLSGST